ncbi:MAG: DEAD/DEAH box helicase, partial [Actinomycetota bacterium]|nr:DEAD/DEAH box helicase [Actinomycetota bacterium]
MVDLNSKLSGVVGGKSAKALADGLDLHTVGDLLRHYPRRYQQRGELTDLSELRVGERVTVFAEVVRVFGRRLRPKLHKTDVVVSDGRRSLDLTFFNQPWRERELREGRRAFFEGTVEVFNRKRQLTNPYYELVDDDEGVVAAEFAGQLVPIYPSAAKVNTFTVQRCVRLLLDQLDPVADPLPDAVRARHRLVGVAAALHDIHRPASWETVRAAQERLKWDEALALQVTLAQRRAAAAANPATPRPPVEAGLLAAFDARLPFALTAGQAEIGGLLASEVAGEHPMHRLLQGEVGSGKTVVALRAMLQVIDAGGQAALLAPTEVLAAQHAASLRTLLGPLA